MNKQDEKMLKKTFEEGFQKSFNDGMLQAGRAICKVIHDKATNTKKSPEERIADIVKFCEVSLGNKKQKG
ncbi:MAG: hypothetical protein IKI94_13130 [Ruminococcus sp.]|nr:hypothetical protein [Ruminococcus sp.]